MKKIVSVLTGLIFIGGCDSVNDEMERAVQEEVSKRFSEEVTSVREKVRSDLKDEYNGLREKTVKAHDGVADIKRKLDDTRSQVDRLESDVSDGLETSRENEAGVRDNGELINKINDKLDKIVENQEENNKSLEGMF